MAGEFPEQVLVIASDILCDLGCPLTRSVFPRLKNAEQILSFLPRRGSSQLKHNSAARHLCVLRKPNRDESQKPALLEPSWYSLHLPRSLMN